MQKRLAIRLSSLGDVILSTASLSAVVQEGQTIDWLTSSEYASLLEGHPGIGKVWKFDKTTGLRGWLKIAREIDQAGYADIYDLHRTLRTFLLKIFLRFFAFRKFKKVSTFKTVSKERFRLYGYFLLKSLWPKAFLPRPWVERYSLILGGDREGRPNLMHLVPRGLKSENVSMILKKLGQSKFICVMPASKWAGKKWPADRFGEVLTKLGLPVVVLGAASDEESVKLFDSLKNHWQSGQVLSAVGRLNLVESAALLACARGYFGNDTGLSHLAEAVGSSVLVTFGPTTPEMGFGPWNDQSTSIRSPVWCAPCGKDGRSCIRPLNRHYCLRAVTSEMVLENAKRWLKALPPPSQNE